jgi:hypothetical protein
MGGIGKLYPAQFFIAMFLKNLIVGCIFLVVAGSATSSDASPSGVMEGHLKVLSSKPVDMGDENAATVTAEDYAEYPLLILSQSEKKEIARITADENGDYRVALPPGDYVLEVQSRPRKHLRWKAQPFTVVSNRTVRVDMDIIAVDQWRAGSTQSLRPD